MQVYEELSKELTLKSSFMTALALNTPGKETQRMREYVPFFASTLPVRRRISAENKQKRVEIQESVIPRCELATIPGGVLLRVKHVAIDFSYDFFGSPGTVPGRITIGKIHHYPSDGPWSPSEKLLVFPHSRCLHEASEPMCQNCTQLQNVPVDQRTYESHQKWPCTQNWMYGQTLGGGLQDFMQVRSAEQALMKLPEHVSVHDCCFLFDIALPFYSFCKDTLCEILAKSPGRILILLNNATTEANDCLLVIHHLGLDHSRFTLSDVANLEREPELLHKYTNKFHHVLVFSRSANAFEMGLACGISTGLAITRNRHTLTVFSQLPIPPSCHRDHPDMTISQVQLSFKDKYLLEMLLDSISELNYSHSQAREEGVSDRRESQTSEDLQETASSTSSTNKKRLRFKNRDEMIEPMTSPKRNLRWLYSDHDFGLCSAHQEFDLPPDYHSSVTINRMIQRGCKLQRVFYTTRPLVYPEVNALVVS